jgi:AcrR family transcriptional regulator
MPANTKTKAVAAPRSNQERTDATRAALIAAAAALFAERGYAGTGTPELVAAASVTRGALYHHFADKQDLFFAVACQAAREVALAIEQSAASAKLPLDALVSGAQGYFAAMSEAGRAKLLLIEAPSVLSAAQRIHLSELSGQTQLEQGLLAAISTARRSKVPTKELTDLVSAAFDQAALAIAHGASPTKYKQAVRWLLQQLAGPSDLA